MKTQTQNNKVLLKTIMMLLIISIFTISNGEAFNDSDGKTSEKEIIESTESNQMIDELLESMELEEFELNDTQSDFSVQIIDKNDEVLFSGSQNDLNNQKQLVIMKRKAEFLIEANGTKIYKVF